VAEINPNGNLLGRVATSFYVHNGPLREDDNGALYLDRNITITSQFPPLTPVSVRLYIRSSELNTLMDASGGAVSSVFDMAVFKNADSCQSAISAPAAKIVPAVPSDWSNGYVFALDVDAFSTFFFAGDQHTVLPVQLLAF